ncbi:glycosyltransferase family 4 protein [Priestia megaterium]|uniref:glycosyltransferase family 4 protein n=1 Tax=Priestia megaterium TaxID=1404 RepID=UPI00390CD3BB
MNIVINAILYHNQPRGVGRYLNSILYELANVDSTNQYYVYYTPWMKDYEFLQIKKENFHFICINIPRNKIIRNFVQGFIFPFLILKHKPDILHVPDTSPVLFKTCPTISNIHDLAEFYFPEKYGKLRSFLRTLIAKSQSKSSNHLITVSNYSKSDIQNKFNISDQKISSIHNGVDLKIFRKDKTLNSHESLKAIIDKPYFLYVGELEKSKNTLLIFEAFLNLPVSMQEKYKIVLAGRKGNDYNRIVEFINNNNMKDKVGILDYVTDEQLHILYSECKAFIFPSLFEGFGLPIIEAMASEAPVICSNASCLPEIGGDAVLLFDPYNAKDLSMQICKLENSHSLSDELIVKGKKRIEHFSWKKAAKETLKVYNSISSK